MHVNTSVKSSVRTLQLFEAFARAKTPLSLGELARSIEAPRSSCLALLGTMTARGYLHRIGDGSYYPSRRLLELAQEVAEHDPIGARIRVALERLRDRSGETAIDSILSADRSLYLDVAESRELVRYTARVGDAKPLHVSASGRAQLAVLPAEACRRLIDRLPAVSEGFRVNRRVLLATIERERTQGWSLNLGEYRADVVSVAAGFMLRDTAHALVIGAPRHRVVERIERLGILVRDEARALAELLR